MHMDVFSPEEYQGLFGWLLESYNTPFDGAFKYSFAIRDKSAGTFMGWWVWAHLISAHLIKSCII